jgi:AhpD family alkylhydroperoxidase
MSRLPIPARDQSPEKSQLMRDAVGKQPAVMPNMFRWIGESPAALEGYLGLNSAMARTLDVKTREPIAMAVAEVDGCDYCPSAHSFLGLNLAWRDETVLAAGAPAIRRPTRPSRSTS